MVTVMKKIHFLLILITSLMLFSCESADELIPTTGNEATAISIILPDGKKYDFKIDSTLINLEIKASSKTDMSKIRMFVSIPNNAKVESDPPLGQYMDFSKPVSFDVVGADGNRKTYTVSIEIIPTIGIREIWKKTGSELGFNKHNNSAIGISGDYIVVHDRAGFSYFNISDGERAGDMSWEGIDWNQLQFKMPLHMTTDDAGNVVSCNAATAAGQEIHMYWWNGVTSKPQLLFSYILDIPNAKNPQVGRKIYVKGDMTKQAYLYLGVSNNNMFLQWEIKNGKVVSQAPKQVDYNIDYTMGIQPKIVPVSLDEHSNYFINRYENGSPKVAITYMDGTTNTPIYKSESHIQDVFHQWLGGGHAFDYVDMNGMKYIFLIEQNTQNWMREIFDVRVLMKDPSSIKSIVNLIHTRKWNDWLYFPLDPILGSNGNVTGEVKARVSADGNSAIVAFLCTNSGVIVWEVYLE